MNFLNRFADPVYCFMRLIVGLMFACHGGQKLLGFPGGGHGGAEGLMLIGGAVELIDGLLIAFGFLTRLAAFVSAGEMAVAYFMAHAPQGFHPINNGGELAILFCFIFLYIAAAGPGPWSVDAAWGSRGGYRKAY